MAILSGGYQGARSCTNGPQPGVWGAMDYFLSAYSSKGGVNTGIYNCRTVRGGRTTSLHGEGRAADFGIRPHSAAYGTALANAIVSMSKELQVQCVIWNRKIWSSSYPRSGWRRYNGVASHVDHLHVEFTWAGANRGRSQAAKLWAKTLGGINPEDIKIGGGGSSNTYKSISGKTPLVKLYHKGEPVKRIQKAVGAKADGYYGPSTVTKVKAYQRKHGLAADGMVGDKTWAKINGGAKAPSTPKAPKFPFPRGHWMGVESSNPKNHSGYHAKDRPGIKQWQQRMLDRGWAGIGKADGRFGPKSQRVARQFQAEKNLAVDGLVGESTWSASWSAPVT